MHNFFSSDISEFAGNLQGIIERGHKNNHKNMHKLGWKAWFFKSFDVSMLVHGCDVLQYHQFYDKIKKYILNVTTSICGKLINRRWCYNLYELHVNHTSYITKLWAQGSYFIYLYIVYLQHCFNSEQNCFYSGTDSFHVLQKFQTDWF